MSLNSLTTGLTGMGLLNAGILLSMLGGIILSLKSLPKLGWSKLKQLLVFRVVVYDYDELFYVLEDWLYSNYKGKYRSVEASYSISPDNYYSWGSITNTESEEGAKRILLKQDVNVFTINRNGKKLLFNKTKEKIEGTKETKRLYSYHYNISGWRAKSHIISLLEEITSLYNRENEDTRLKMYLSSWSEWSSIIRREVKPLSSTVLNKETKRTISEDLNSFTTSREWYKQVNIPYKRGYLFYGPPGTGKTTLSLAIAREVKRPIYVLNLGSISSDENLIRLVSNIEDNSVLLMEDIDAAFINREGNKQSKISFSCLLNCLDGALSKENVITIMTTNHIERLDPALIRPGRVDVQLEIPKASQDEVSEYLSLFYDQPINDIPPVTAPMSSIQEICIRNKSMSSKAVEEIIKTYGNTITNQIREEQPELSCSDL